MTDTQREAELPNLPAAVSQPRRRWAPQFIWVIPIVAVLVGAGLAAKVILERGPTITISFKTGEGLEAVSYTHLDVYKRQHQPEGLERSLVFALTAVVLFVIANSFPIVSMNSRGLTSSTTLLGAVGVLLHDDMPSVALLVFVTTFLMPALEIGALIYLLLPLKLGRVPPAVPRVFRLLHACLLYTSRCV